MSPIIPNALATDFSAPATPDEFGSPGRFARQWSSIAAPVDDIRNRVWGGTSSPNDVAGSVSPGAPGAAGGSTVGGIMSALLDALSNLFGQLGSLLQGAGAGQYGAQPAGAQPAGSSPGGVSPGDGQSFFHTASGGSVGDPHDSFSGNGQSGRNVAAKWDSMQAHDDLLSSDSFAGGYRVATSVSHAGSGGITQNDRATVTADGGATSVTMNRDGSYSAFAEGRNLRLETGRATLAGSATVTLNADRSLTVDELNARGGELSTTLKPNGSGGVDVAATGHDVDLGGYLVQRANGAPGDAAQAPAPAPADWSNAQDSSNAEIRWA